MTASENSTREDFAPASATALRDLDAYLGLPRVSGLAVSRDGSRVALVVAQLDEKKTKFVSSIWEADPAGGRAARRIAFSERGESAPVFAADGSLLFLSSRGSGEGGEDPPASVWRLPAEGGEASEIARFPGAVSAVLPAAAAAATVATVRTLSGANSLKEDEKLRKLRQEGKVSAILHTGYPVRFWDHDLGPDAPRLWLLGEDAPVDLTPPPAPAQVKGRGLSETSADLAADGSFLVTSFFVPAEQGSRREVLVRVDAATGESRVLLDDPEGYVMDPKISPDQTQVAYRRESRSSPTEAPRITVHVLSLVDGSTRQLAPDWDLWPGEIAWSQDGEALYIVADENGRAPIFRVDAVRAGLGGTAPVRLTADDFAYTALAPALGGAVFALRSSYLRPPHPVRIGADGSVVELPSPASELQLPGTLEELTTVLATGEPAQDSTVRSWLVLPAGAGQERPAPLVLWVHGGPLSSWNAWSWRWNPWLLAAKGYALLLPDPALSTGYGQSFIQRGWGDWGGATFADLMAAVDAALGHPAVDQTRTAAMGGSFGGYMANWIAGHTDRFKAIVTHASLWALDQFGATTDESSYWLREMTEEMALANSPHLHVENIRTPMLVVHGDKDYRVPVGEGLRLWWDLLSRSQLAADEHGQTPHRFLYFPNENHWVLQPQDAKLWYQVVFGFLAEHVLGEEAEPPEVLGL
ncbi:MAG: S9 family peptidase [Segniliparus sp.]|uniref:S9 family peptidase n=1 Tax=Segniliparus sp. TaxID=2804064 RepID=UPI003F342372